MNTALAFMGRQYGELKACRNEGRKDAKMHEEQLKSRS